MKQQLTSALMFAGFINDVRNRCDYDVGTRLLETVYNTPVLFDYLSKPSAKASMREHETRFVKCLIGLLTTATLASHQKCLDQWATGLLVGVSPTYNIDSMSGNHYYLSTRTPTVFTTRMVEFVVYAEGMTDSRYRYSFAMPDLESYFKNSDVAFLKLLGDAMADLTEYLKDADCESNNSVVACGIESYHASLTSWIMFNHLDKSNNQELTAIEDRLERLPTGEIPHARARAYSNAYALAVKQAMDRFPGVKSSGYLMALLKPSMWISNGTYQGPGSGMLNAQYSHNGTIDLFFDIATMGLTVLKQALSGIPTDQDLAIEKPFNLGTDRQMVVKKLPDLAKLIERQVRWLLNDTFVDYSLEWPAADTPA